MGIRNCDLSPKLVAENRLGAWYANIFKIGRHKTLIFVNEKTLFSFVVMKVTKKDFLDFSSLFVENLTAALEVVNFNYAEIVSIKEECTAAIEITKTSDKKILGAMNEVVFHFSSFLHEGSSLEEATFHCNQIPHKNLTSYNSIEALLDLTAR